MHRYTHTQANRKTDRQTDRQTYNQGIQTTTERTDLQLVVERKIVKSGFYFKSPHHYFLLLSSLLSSSSIFCSFPLLFFLLFFFFLLLLISIIIIISHFDQYKNLGQKVAELGIIFKHEAKKNCFQFPNNSWCPLSTNHLPRAN